MKGMETLSCQIITEKEMRQENRTRVLCMKKAKLLFWNTSLNRYSINALLGALENSCELFDIIDIGFFIKTNDIYESIDDLKKYEKVIVAFSFFTPQIWDVNNLITQLAPIRDELDIVFVAGGPHATGDPVRTVTTLGFDYALLGESEATFPIFILRIIEGISLTGLKGICYKDHDGNVINTGQSDPVDITKYTPVSLRFRRIGPVEITRGCPYGCSFCQTGHILGRCTRHRPTEQIYNILKAMKTELNASHFRAITPNALSYGSGNGVDLNLPELEKLLITVRKALGPGAKIHMGSFPSEVRPNNVTNESIGLLKRFVSNRDLVVGAQSGSERILKLSHRGHSVDDVYKAVEIITRHGFLANVDFIFGLPGETVEDAEMTVKMMSDLADMGARIHAHTFMPLPQTEFENAPYGRVKHQIRKMLRDLTPKGIVFGNWEEQARLSKKIHTYLAKGIL